MNIESKIKNILQEQLNVDADYIKNESTLVEDLGADSLDIVEIIMTLEETFDIEISDEDIKEHHIDTVNSVIDLVNVKLPK